MHSSIKNYVKEIETIKIAPFFFELKIILLGFLKKILNHLYQFCVLREYYPSSPYLTHISHNLPPSKFTINWGALAHPTLLELAENQSKQRVLCLSNFRIPRPKTLSPIAQPRWITPCSTHQTILISPPNLPIPGTASNSMATLSLSMRTTPKKCSCSVSWRRRRLSPRMKR